MSSRGASSSRRTRSSSRTSISDERRLAQKGSGSYPGPFVFVWARGLTRPWPHWLPGAYRGIIRDTSTAVAPAFMDSAFRRLLTFLVLAGAACVLSCGPNQPPLRPPRPLVTRYDSVLDSAAHTKGPAWRSLHYPIADLHGPYRRPELADSTADPNDALSYYRLGDSVRRTLPGLADRAFYWALRLDPTFADAYFARWRLLRREFPWREMPDGSIRRIFAVQAGAGLATDSLLNIAIAYSPFLEGSLDFPRWIINADERRPARDPIMAG